MATFIIFALFALAHVGSAQKPPNILLLMPDQWRWDWDGLSHPHVGEAPPIHLPHIERLRSLGTTFPRGGVVPSPVCAPSRASMASLREYDFAGVATNKANDYRATENPTYFTALQRADPGPPPATFGAYQNKGPRIDSNQTDIF